MSSSVHAVRWINQISDRGWDIHLFSSTPDLVHPDLRNVTVYGVSASRPEGLDPSVQLRGVWPLQRGSGLISYLALRYQALSFSPWGLAKLIRWLKPDIVHSMEIQHAGYLTSAARAKLGGRFPTWVVSNWGSDIYLFGRLSEHHHKIKAVLSACDYYDAECHRDVELAKEFGFKGEVLPVLPNTGGFDLQQARQLRQPGPTSARRLIALKGYQGWVYRALVGLRGIELCADLLKEKGYRIAIYLASPETKIAAELLAKSS